jgi:hypothetical protein
MSAALKLYTVFEEGSNIPKPLPPQEWVEYMHSLVKEPYTAEEVNRFIRCCEANRSRLERDPQMKANLMARVDAALDAPAMGGQYPPDRLIDYVFDVLMPMGTVQMAEHDKALLAVTEENGKGAAEERALAKDGSEFGVIGRNGARRIIDAKAERDALKEKGGNPRPSNPHTR